MWILAIVATLAAIFVVRYITGVIQRRRIYFDLPGEESYSYLYGTFHKYPGFNLEGMKYEVEIAQRCKYFRVGWEGPLKPMVYFHHPESLRALFKMKEPKPRHHLLASAYDMVATWLGEGLITSNNQTWAVHRKLITPAFHFSILQPYVDIYNSCAQVLVEQMKKRCSETSSVDIFSFSELCSLDVILQCAFSYQSDCQTSGHNEYISALMELQNLVIDRVLTPHHIFDFIYHLSSKGRYFKRLCDLVHKKADDVIAKRKAALENATSEELEKIKNKKKKDFLDILLLARVEDGTGMDPFEIRSEVDTFMFAGHDTTASGVAWTLYCLAKHPEYQERVYQEVLEVLEDRETVQWADLAKLEYTTMCLKEGLRQYSPVSYSGRELTEDLVIGGYTLPAGTQIAIKIWTLHNNPQVWDDPMTYDPERFHPDNQNHMDPFQFIPFSAGNRNCIGQNFAMNEMKVAIAQVIKNFTLTDDPSCTPEPKAGLTLKSANGIMVKLTLRSGRN